jgi:hypothetical protein
MKQTVPKQRFAVRIEPVPDLFDDGHHVKTAVFGTHQNLVIGAPLGSRCHDTVNPAAKARFVEH